MAKHDKDISEELGLPPGIVPDWAWLLELVDDEEAARLCGLRSGQTLRKRRLTGDTPIFIRLDKHSRGRVRYRRLDVLRWAAARRHTSTSAEAWPEPAVGALPRGEG